MEKSIIEEIYYGNCGNYDSFRMDERESGVLGKLDEVYTKLLEILNGEERELFKEFCDLNDELTSDEATKNYVEGFKIGVKVGREVFIERWTRSFADAQDDRLCFYGTNKVYILNKVYDNDPN